MPQRLDTHYIAIDSLAIQFHRFEEVRELGLLQELINWIRSPVLKDRIYNLGGL